MANAEPPRKVRGVYEHPKGSGVWWISYHLNRKRRRERVGRRSDAIALYAKRKTQILQNEKLPELNRQKVSLGDLIDGVLAYAKEHEREMRNFTGKAELVRAEFGARAAEDIRPSEFRDWIRSTRGKSAATFNRYRSFLSTCYREGIRDGKVTSNPARQIMLRSEGSGRKRFASRNEFDQWEAAIAAAYPTSRFRRAAFVISVYTGMRKSEQYKLRWRQCDFDRREIHLKKTKNGDDRDVPMASVVYDELVALKAKAKDSRPSALVFPRRRGADKAAVDGKWFTALLRSPELGLAGHRNITTTAIYAHLSPDYKRSEVERLVPEQKPKIAVFPAKVG